MKLFKGLSAEIVSYLFQTLLATYLIFLLLEQILGGLASVYMNLNYFLVIVIVLGVLDVFSEVKVKEKERVKKRDYVFVSVLGIIGLIVIRYKTLELGWLSWAISVIAGVLVVFLGLLVLEDKDG